LPYLRRPYPITLTIYVSERLLYIRPVQ